MGSNQSLRVRRSQRWIAAALAAVVTLSCGIDDSSSDAPAVSPIPDADQVKIGGVLWYVDYDAALVAAREQDKALWVHFGENPG